MPHAQLTESIRSLAVATFARLGLASSHELRESLLMRAGTYCGRRFEAERGFAVWLADEGRIRFFAADGSLLTTMELHRAEVPTQRLAA